MAEGVSAALSHTILKIETRDDQPIVLGFG